MLAPSRILLALIVLGACADPDLDDGPDGRDDEFLKGDDLRGGQSIVDGTDAARGVLRVANRAHAEELGAGGVGLYPRTVASLLTHRLGPDGEAGTADDRTVATLAELDGLPWVGEGSLRRLLVYARTHGFDAPAACEATSPRAVPAALVIGPDDGAAPVLERIAAARRSLDVVIYQLSSDEVIQALGAAAARGVRVRVILDGKQAPNARVAGRLQGMGVAARLSSTDFVYTHQKTIVFDEREALISTANLDHHGLHGGRNHGVVTADWQDVDDLVALFHADWNALSPDLSCTRLVVSPVNAGRRILSLIASARDSVDVEAMYVIDPGVIEALLAARRRGVAVRVLLNDLARALGDEAAGQTLASGGVEVRRAAGFFVHSKMLIVDGERLFAGSENFSRNSLYNNREVGVVMSRDEIDLGRVRATFEHDWARSSPQ
jgi:cardiolipin synthase A/B